MNVQGAACGALGAGGAGFAAGAGAGAGAGGFGAGLLPGVAADAACAVPIHSLPPRTNASVLPEGESARSLILASPSGIATRRVEPLLRSRIAIPSCVTIASRRPSLDSSPDDPRPAS